MTLRLLLIRHGLSSFNMESRIQGRNDLSILTSEGAQQAAKAAKAIEDINIEAVYSSPLQRAASTTEELIKFRKKKLLPIFDQNLLEVDLSLWSGLTIDEVKSRFSDDYKRWENDPNELVLKRPNGTIYNPIKELMQQADAFIEKLLLDHKPEENKNLLVVAHNAILRCLILRMLGEPKQGFRRIKLDNASISIINLLPNDNNSYKLQIESLNNTTHLQQPLPVKSNNARIFLVRHGETNWNQEGRFQGQIDIPLNEKGKSQAKSTGRFLKGIHFNKAFSSSLSRPMKTAELILENKNIKIKPEKDLIEIGHGLWEGKLESEIEDEWNDLLIDWQNSPEKVQMPQGESIEEVWNRSVRCWESICKDLKPDETALVVAHDAVNKTILCNLLGLKPANIWMIKQGNGGITVIDITSSDNQPDVIRSMNITSHIGGVIDQTATGAL